MIPRAAWAAALCLAVVTSPVPLHAAVRPFIGLGGGWGTHAMSDINAEIRAINQAAAPFRLAEISDGTTVGAEFGVKLPGGRTLAVAYDRVSASSFTGDPSLYLQYDLPANVFRFTAAQTVRLYDRLGARVGGSIGVLSEKGMFRVVAPGAASQTNLRGRSAMGEVFGGLGLAAGRHCDL